MSLLSGINLNLLLVLDMLLKEQNVSKAAEKLNLTQPTISNSLKQLRVIFNDELLFRGPGNRMLLTGKAKALRRKVAETVSKLENIFYSEEKFNPDKESYHFKLGMSDYAAIIYLPKIMKNIERYTDNISIEVVHLNNIWNYEDYYKRFSSNVTEKNKMKVLKASNIVTGCICCLGSLLFLNYQSTLELQWLLAGIFGGGILGLFVLSIITYKIKSSAALTGVIVGILIITYLTFSQIDKIWLSYLSKCELNNLLTPVFGTLAVILIGFLVSYFIANKCKKKNSNKV